MDAPCPYSSGTLRSVIHLTLSLVPSPPQCIVKTYLQWLGDSEYNPNCPLCQSDLNDGRETIRLSCFGKGYKFLFHITTLIMSIVSKTDVFHWECLNKYAEGFPATTTPAGYRCPLCQVGFRMFLFFFLSFPLS